MNQNFKPRSSVKGYRSRPLIDDFSVRRIRAKQNSTTNRQPEPMLSNHYSNSVINHPKLYKTPNPSVQPKKSSKSKKRLFTKNNILFSFAIVIVLSAVIFNVLNILNKNASIISGAQEGLSTVTEQEATEDNGQATTSLSNVDETEPRVENVRKYSVASDLPRFINIPSIGVNAKILRLGVNNNNEILTPKNIYDTGWYEGSSKPGEPGAVFINGHVSGPTKKGVFYNIKKLNPGDVIKLELGNADLIEYKVVYKEDIPVDQVNMNKVLRSYDIDKQGLNLMTCGGEFDKSSDSYKNRTIIYTVRN